MLSIVEIGKERFACRRGGAFMAMVATPSLSEL
jgi:hypothetical protein